MLMKDVQSGRRSCWCCDTSMEKSFTEQERGMWENKTQTRHQRASKLPAVAEDRKRRSETKRKRKNLENHYTPNPKQHLSAQFLFSSLPEPAKDSHVFLSEHMWLTSTSFRGRDGPRSLPSAQNTPSLCLKLPQEVNNPPYCLFPESWTAAKDYSPHPACYRNF